MITVPDFTWIQGLSEIINAVQHAKTNKIHYIDQISTRPIIAKFNSESQSCLKIQKTLMVGILELMIYTVSFYWETLR